MLPSSSRRAEEIRPFPTFGDAKVFVRSRKMAPVVTPLTCVQDCRNGSFPLFREIK
jgi:hypothetical protein